MRFSVTKVHDIIFLRNNKKSLLDKSYATNPYAIEDSFQIKTNMFIVKTGKSQQNRLFLGTLIPLAFCVKNIKRLTVEYNMNFIKDGESMYIIRSGLSTVRFIDVRNIDALFYPITNIYFT